MGDQEARDREVLERAVRELTDAVFGVLLTAQQKQDLQKVQQQREPPSVGSPRGVRCIALNGDHACSKAAELRLPSLQTWGGGSVDVCEAHAREIFAVVGRALGYSGVALSEEK